MAVATRLTSTGILYTSGPLDEVTLTVNRVTSNSLYASEFDEVTINPISNGLAKRETSTGKLLVSGYFDEVTPIS